MRTGTRWGRMVRGSLVGSLEPGRVWVASWVLKKCWLKAGPLPNAGEGVEMWSVVLVVEWDGRQVTAERTAEGAGLAPREEVGLQAQFCGRRGLSLSHSSDLSLRRREKSVEGVGLRLEGPGWRVRGTGESAGSKESEVSESQVPPLRAGRGRAGTGSKPDLIVSLP